MQSKLQNDDRLVRGSVFGVGGGVTHRDSLQVIIRCKSFLHEIVDKPATGHFLSLLTSAFQCQYHSTIAPYSFIHLPPTLYNAFLPVLQFSPVSIIPLLLHTHPFIHLPPTLYNVFLPLLQFSPVSIIPPLLHTHPSIYHPRCIMFFSQYFSFTLSVSFHHCSILILKIPLSQEQAVKTRDPSDKAMFCLILGNITLPNALTVSSSGFRRQRDLLHTLGNNIQLI